MSHHKYVYDPGKLHYAPVENNLKHKFIRVLVYLISSIFLALAAIVLFSLVFDTPRERELRQENEALLQDYEILSRKYDRVDTVLHELREIDENIYRTIFETEPVNELSGNGAMAENSDVLLQQTNRLIVAKTANALNEAMHRITSESVEYQHLLSYAGNRSEMLSCIPAIQPIKDPDLTRLASGFGYRMHPIYKIEKMHEGIDFTAPTGTEVYASGDGVVADLDRTARGHGNTVIIDHGYGYRSIYSHLEKFNVRRGKHVKRGDIIGWVGNTGLSVAPHLHYEVHMKDKAVNPVNYFFLDLRPESYNRLIELSVKSGQSFD